MLPRKLEVGDIVQIAPEHDPLFGGKLMIVSDPKAFGAQGYVDTFEGRAYYRVAFENMEYCGHVEWVDAEHLERENSGES